MIQKDHDAALWQAGAMHIQLQNWFRAKAPFEQLLKKHPENADILINLGGVHSKLGEFAEAARYYEKAVKLSPDRPGLHDTLNAVRRQIPGGGR